MATPTTIIDHCLSPTKQWFFALETDKIWRAEHIGAIAKPTWQHVMTALDGATFHRMVAPTFGTVYVLATKPGAVNNDAVMYKTVNNGLTWSTHDVAQDIGLGLEYTVTHPDPVDHYLPASSLRAYQEHTRHGTPGSGSQPFGMAKHWTGTGAKFNSIGWDYRTAASMPPSEDDYIHLYQSSNDPKDQYRVMKNNAISGGEITKLESWFDSEFGAGVWVAGTGYNPGANMPNEAGRVRVGYSCDRDGTIDVTVQTWVFWNEPQPVAATALAAAPSNGSWIYVGFEDQIVMTKNAGVDWEVVTEDYGAYDIAVNPLLAGVITFWTPTGELRQAIAGEVQAAILTETAIQQAHRIAYSRDNGGKLWVLAYNGATFDLKMYNLGSWATKQSGISGAAGLNTYVKGSGLNYVLYLSGDNIYYSEDDGATVAAKIGDWSGYASPVRIDML